MQNGNWPRQNFISTKRYLQFFIRPLTHQEQRNNKMLDKLTKIIKIFGHGFLLHPSSSSQLGIAYSLRRL
jgi:hypothetical protein